MRITYQFPDGTLVSKFVKMPMTDEQLYDAMLRRTKEAYRDYLFSIYGDEWQNHDASAGKFWG